MENRTRSPLLFLSGLMLLCGTLTVSTANELAGTWEITVDVDGRVSFSYLCLVPKEDGTFSGTWNDAALSHITFADNKLAFRRTVKGRDEQEFTTDYSAVLQDGKLTGTLSNDWFVAPFIGTRARSMCPALGTWDITFTVGDRDITARLSITQNPDGTLSGTWTEEGEHRLSGLTFQDGTLSFTRQSKINDFAFETTYKGVLKDNDLTGMLEGGDMGRWQANARRVGAPLIGTWEFENTSPWGPPTRRLIIYPDMTGRYQWFDEFIPIKDLTLEGDQVTFKIESRFGDRTFVTDFKGKLAEDTLNGEMTSERGTRPANGKKVKETMKNPEKETTRETAGTTDKKKE